MQPDPHCLSCSALLHAHVFPFDTCENDHLAEALLSSGSCHCVAQPSLLVTGTKRDREQCCVSVCLNETFQWSNM